MPTFQVPEDDSSLLSDTGSGMDIEGDSFIAQVNKINRIKTEEENKAKEDAYIPASLVAPKQRNPEWKQQHGSAVAHIINPRPRKYDPNKPRAFFNNWRPSKYDWKSNLSGAKEYLKASTSTSALAAPKSPKAKNNVYIPASLVTPNRRNREWAQQQATNTALLNSRRSRKYDLKPKWPRERGTPPLFKQPERVAEPGRVTPERVQQPERDIPMLNSDLPSSTGKRKRGEYEPQPPARDTYSISASDIEQGTNAPAVRRIGGMILTIISCAAMFVARILKYLRDQVRQGEEVLAVETDSSGRKRRAVSTTSPSSASKENRKISPAFPAADTIPAAKKERRTISQPVKAMPSYARAEKSPEDESPDLPVANMIPAAKKERHTISQPVKAMPSYARAEKSLKDEKVDDLITRSKASIESRHVAREEARRRIHDERNAEAKKKEEEAREYLENITRRNRAQRNARDAETLAAAWKAEPKRWAREIEQKRRAEEAEAAERVAEDLARQKAIEDDIARKAAEEAERVAAEESAKQKAIEDELARLVVEEEKKAKAEEEERVKAEGAAKLKAEKEARLKAEEEARLKAEQEKARAEAEEEATHKAEEERLANDPLARVEAEEKARKDEEERLTAEAAGQADYERKQILIRPLAPAWDDRLKEAMATKRETVLATSPEGVSLSRRDFGTLLPQEGTSDDSSGWLNDEIINAMFQSIVMRKAEQTQRSKHHGGTVPVYESYNSSWWQTAASKKGVQGLDRWGRRKNISGDKLLQCEKVFMPINTGAHWTLIIVSPQEKTIEYLDSMNGKGINALKQTRAWLQMELGALYHPEEWTEKRGQSGKQANSDDCGVFTIMNGLAAAKHYPYSAVKSADMPLARRTIAAILLNKGLDGDWEL